MRIRVVGVAIALLSLVASGCSESGSGALSDYWMGVDPCDFGDQSKIEVFLGGNDITTEVIEQHPLVGDSSIIKGKTCVFEVKYGPRLSIGFTQGTSSLDRGGRSTELAGIGDEARLGVFDDGEIMGIFANVEAMWLSIAPGAGDDRMEGSPEAEQMIEIARVAADRLRAVALDEP